MKNRCTGTIRTKKNMECIVTLRKDRKQEKEKKRKWRQATENKEKMRRGMMEKGKTREGYPQDPLYHILQ